MNSHDGRRVHPRHAQARRRRGVEVRFARRRGKGSHGTLYFGERKTIVKDRKKELSRALLGDMLRQLGLEPRDLT
jgi:mRNA interferase HicA